MHMGLILSLIPEPSVHQGTATEETCVLKHIINTKTFLPISCPSTRACRHNRNRVPPNTYNLLPDSSSWHPPFSSSLRYNTSSTSKFLGLNSAVLLPSFPFFTSFSMPFLPFLFQWNFFLIFTLISFSESCSRRLETVR